MLILLRIKMALISIYIYFGDIVFRQGLVYSWFYSLKFKGPFKLGLFLGYKVKKQFVMLVNLIEFLDFKLV